MARSCGLPGTCACGCFSAAAASSSPSSRSCWAACRGCPWLVQSSDVSSNPFSTRFIRPGAIEFLFPPGQTVEKLVETLHQHDWQGQIIGPHGSGKSTLLAALVPGLAAAGRRVRSHGPGGLGPEGNNEEIEEMAGESLDESTQLVIDGFEQLSWWSRRKVKHACKSRGAGLLVTAHQDMGLPTLWRTEPSRELTQAVVVRLLPPGDETVKPEDVERAFAVTGGNLRETLFALYDVYQQRRR